MRTSVLLSYRAQQRPGSSSAYGSFCRPYGANVVCGSRVAGVPRCALHPCLNPVAPHGAICSKLMAHCSKLIAQKSFFEIFWAEIWWFGQNALPLQSLLENGGIAQSVRASDS